MAEELLTVEAGRLGGSCRATSRGLAGPLTSAGDLACRGEANQLRLGGWARLPCWRQASRRVGGWRWELGAGRRDRESTEH